MKPRRCRTVVDRGPPAREMRVRVTYPILSSSATPCSADPNAEAPKWALFLHIRCRYFVHRFPSAAIQMPYHYPSFPRTRGLFPLRAYGLVLQSQEVWLEFSAPPPSSL